MNKLVKFHSLPHKNETRDISKAYDSLRIQSR